MTEAMSPPQPVRQGSAGKKFFIALILLAAAGIYGLRYAWDPILEGRLPMPSVVRARMARLSAPKGYWDDLVRVELSADTTNINWSSELTHRYAGAYELGLELQHGPTNDLQGLRPFRGVLRCAITDGARVIATLTSTPGIRRRYYTPSGSYALARDVLIAYHVPPQALLGKPVQVQLVIDRMDADYLQRYGPAVLFLRKQLE